MLNIETKIEFLFIDMEWNQKSGTKGLEGREPIQIELREYYDVSNTNVVKC